jgi:hypothetical protein
LGEEVGEVPELSTQLFRSSLSPATPGVVNHLSASAYIADPEPI